MKIFDWQALLTEWNHVLLNSKLSNHVPDSIRQAGSLGHLPATEAEITALEQRINHALPPSYRQFLAVTNGWPRLSVSIDQVWSTREVAWFSERNSATIEALEDLNLEDIDLMRAGLEVSEFSDGEAILLNPEVIDDDGEWQAVRIHDTDPPQSYDNFWELMKAEFQSLKLSMALSPGIFGPLDIYPPHEADREKVNMAISLIEERIHLTERTANHRVPQDQQIQLQQMTTMLKNLLAQLTELKHFEGDPGVFSQRKTALLETLRQPAFFKANYPIRFILDYCISVLE